MRVNEPIYDDFNGDAVMDTAKFVTRNNKAGILIIHGLTYDSTSIGGGTAFAEMGDDFSWVDYWGVVKDKETYHIKVENSEIVGEEVVRLSSPSIFLRKVEVGGGIITYKNGKYQWVHQAD